MTFTYDGTLDTDLEKVRFEIGDTDPETALFSDEEIQYKITENASNILKTSAALCYVLAIRFSQQVTFSMDGQRVDLSDKSKAYQKMGDALMERYQNNVSSNIITTKIDGFSSSLQTPPNATDRVSDYRDFDTGGCI